MSRLRRALSLIALGLLLAGVAGCGKTIARTATEQLVLSDAVDRSIASIDFRALSGQTVYLDTTWIKEIKNNSFVNADYIVGSLRQQMVAARCLLQEKREDADYVVEARVGTLGADSHEVIFGLPANNLLSAASSVVPGAPQLPTIPEISAAKVTDQMAAAKIAVFAYNRETREPVWQSGLAVAKSKAKDTWLLGAGPFESGSIHKGTRFAGGPLWGADDPDEPEPVIAYDKEMHFLETPPARLAVRPGESPQSPESPSAVPAQPPGPESVVPQPE